MKKRIRNDVIFIVAIVLISCSVGLAFFFFRGGGDVVAVTVDGAVYGEYPLSSDSIVEIISDYGRNVLVIENGKAYVKEASCPDGICAAHRPVSRDGESIVCLPNKVVVTVKQDSPDGPDVVA